MTKHSSRDSFFAYSRLRYLRRVLSCRRERVRGVYIYISAPGTRAQIEFARMDCRHTIQMIAHTGRRRQPANMKGGEPPWPFPSFSIRTQPPPRWTLVLKSLRRHLRRIVLLHFDSKKHAFASFLSSFLSGRRRLINCSNLNLVTRRVPFNNAVIRQQRVSRLYKSAPHLAPNRIRRVN